MRWNQASIRIEILHAGNDRGIEFSVDSSMMRDARQRIDHAKERADNLARQLCTSPTEAEKRQRLREQIADTARAFVLNLLSEADTINGYQP